MATKSDTKKTSKASTTDAPAKVTSPKQSPKPSSAKAPQTMEELLAQTTSEIIVPQKGQAITGVIKEKAKKMLIVDIGAKTEGVVADKEYSIAANYIEELKVGDTIEAQVLSSVNDRGHISLSLKQAALDAKWDFFQTALDEGQILDAKGIDANKGGLIVMVENVRGFVPSSQFGKEFMGKIRNLRGKIIQVKAIEVDREKNRLIFSERHVSEADELAQREQALEQVESGKVYDGVVSGVMPFGLFVTVEVPVSDGKDGEVGHVEGLVHISEISWEKVHDPKDYHKVGDKIQVKVLGVDDHNGKLNLSLKQLQDDPWQSITDSYQVGTTFDGTVTRVENFGVFVNVEPGVDGLIHSSKLSPGQIYKKGDTVTVTVESVDPDQRRMSLSVVSTTAPEMYR